MKRKSVEHPHPLPISYGYGASSTNGVYDHVEVWCGKCNDYFDIDGTWITRYMAVERRQLDKAKDRGDYTPGQLLDYERRLDEQERGFRELVRRPRVWQL